MGGTVGLRFESLAEGERSKRSQRRAEVLARDVDLRITVSLQLPDPSVPFG